MATVDYAHTHRHDEDRDLALQRLRLGAEEALDARDEERERLARARLGLRETASPPESARGAPFQKAPSGLLTHRLQSR